jgi:Metallo-beta-lactamase superfamily
MIEASVAEVLPGLWRFEGVHPDWTEEEWGEEGWDPVVASWAASTARGVLLIDPLAFDWTDLDRVVEQHGSCAGIVRTIHWHQRSAAEAADRYGAAIWAGRSPTDGELQPSDHRLEDGDELWDRIQAFTTERADEIALWLPTHAALLFGDAMLRGQSGQLRVCPESWEQPAGGPDRLRAVLRGLTRLPVEHVLVSHGPLALGRGRESLQAALG